MDSGTVGLKEVGGQRIDELSVGVLGSDEGIGRSAFVTDATLEERSMEAAANENVNFVGIVKRGVDVADESAELEVVLEGVVVLGESEVALDRVLLDEDGGSRMEVRVDTSDNLLESEVAIAVTLGDNGGNGRLGGETVLNETVNGLFHAIE